MDAYLIIAHFQYNKLSEPEQCPCIPETPRRCVHTLIHLRVARWIPGPTQVIIPNVPAVDNCWQHCILFTTLLPLFCVRLQTKWRYCPQSDTDSWCLIASDCNRTQRFPFFFPLTQMHGCKLYKHEIFIIAYRCKLLTLQIKFCFLSCQCTLKFGLNLEISWTASHGKVCSVQSRDRSLSYPVSPLLKVAGAYRHS